MLMKNLMLNDNVDDNIGFSNGVVLEGGVYASRQAIFSLFARGMATLAEALGGVYSPLQAIFSLIARGVAPLAEALLFLHLTLLLLLLLLSSHCHR